MYRDISLAERNGQGWNVRLREREHTSSPRSDQAIQGDRGAFLPDKYFVNCDDDQPTSGGLEYIVEDSSLSRPVVSEMVRNALGENGNQIVEQEKADYIAFLKAFERNRTSWDEVAWSGFKTPSVR